MAFQAFAEVKIHNSKRGEMPHTVRQYVIRGNALAQGTKRGTQPHFHKRTQAERARLQAVAAAPAQETRATPAATEQGAQATPAATAREARVTPAATARHEPWSTGDDGATRAVEQPFARKVYPLLYEIDVLS